MEVAGGGGAVEGAAVVIGAESSLRISMTTDLPVEPRNCH